MKSVLLVGTVCLCLVTAILADQENCVEEPTVTDPCASFTEYTAYITCLDENKRHKRSVGCPLLNQVESCEYVDCQNCEETCLPDCPDCECPPACRQCCSETCATNLCCHKTCHNQCKTNYCRTECKKECKERINQQGSSSNAELGLIVEESSNINNTAKHNITTIINLHNIINNTNLIDIPIKINNTNFNNITLKRSDQISMSGQYSGGGQIQPRPETDPETGEKCCYVVSPRQCVKTNYYPFMRCFHYRHRKCGPFCIATIIHAQNQNYCDDSGCHNKIFYVPQNQPQCYYTPSYPFVNCGGQQTFHNCQGCYDHISSGTATTGIHHHMRCSRCYDSNAGSPMPQMMQPQMMPGYPMGMGYPMGPQMGMGYPMGPPMGYPGGFYGGYPPMSPMYQPYPAYGQPGMAMGPMSYGQQPAVQFYGQNNNDIIDTQSNFNEINSNYPVSQLLRSGSTDGNEINPSYPMGNPIPYVHETVIPVTKLLKSGSTENDENNKTSLEDSNTGASKYALISIDAAKPNNHHKREEKEKKYRRKKNKSDHEHTTERKKEASTTEKKL